MSKVLQRALFKNSGLRTPAHGTGITTYFMDDRPGFADGELVDYNKLMQDYLSKPTAEMPEAPASDFDTLFKKYSDVVGKSLGPERTYDDLLKERMRILGPNVDSESARNYALMQLGSKIASTRGGLSQGIAAGMPEYAGVMSKAEAERRALERSAGASALEALDKERGLRRGAETEAAKYAFTESEAAKKSAYSAAVEAAKEDAKRRFDVIKEGAKSQNETDAKLALSKPESFAVLDSNSPGGFKIVNAIPTREGWRQVGTNERIPDNAAPVGDAFMSSLLKQGESREATNISIQNPDGTFSKPIAAFQKGPKFYDASTNTVIDRPFRLVDKAGSVGSGTSSSYVIQDPSSPFGIKEVIGFTDPMTQQNYYMNNGVRFDFDSGKGIKASLSDVLKSDTKDGEVTTTPSFGPYAGKPFTVSSAKRNVQFKPPVPNEDPSLLGKSDTTTKDKTVGETTEPTMGQITTKGPERYFVKEVSGSSVPYSQWSSQDKQDSRDRVQGAEVLLATAEENMKAMQDALGPLNNIKALSTKWISPIAPKALDGYVTYLKSTAGQQQLRIMRQGVQLAMAKNPRFPQGELATIDSMIQDPDSFFSDPRKGISDFASIVRNARNTLEWERATKEGRKPLYIERIPTGTENDAFSYDQLPYLFELQKSGVNINDIFFKDKDGSTKRVRDVSR